MNHQKAATVEVVVEVVRLRERIEELEAKVSELTTELDGLRKYGIECPNCGVTVKAEHWRKP